MHKWRTPAILLLLFCTGALVRADDKPASAKEAYDALQKDMQKAQQDLGAKFREAKTEEERTAIRDQFFKMFAPRVLAIAEKHPKDPMTLQMIPFVLMASKGSKEADKALDLLITHHAEGNDIAELIAMLGQIDAPGVDKFLRTVVEKNKQKPMQGRAAFALAQSLKTRSEGTSVKKEDALQLARDAEKAFELVIEKYAIINGDAGPIGDAAKKELFELRNLGIGKVAPQIEGEDVDGKKFKLTDYRGKVVVLDFWGHW